MKAIRIYALLALLLMAGGATKAHAQSTVGNNFWVTVLPNGDEIHSQGSPKEPNLRITGDRPCTGTVTNPYTGWSEAFEVAVGQATIINIPVEQAYAQDTSDCVLETALHVVTTDAVSVVVADYRRGSVDVSCVFPVSSLGSDYLVQTFNSSGDQEGERAVLSVIAVEDNTTVDFLLSCDTKYGHHANEPFSVTLQAGQCYQLQSVWYQNFTGSRVTVHNKKQKLAVFAGNRDTSVPDISVSYLDHVEEQLMPVTALGRRFVVTQTLQRYSDWVRITTLKEHCKIWRDGDLVGTINPEQSFNIILTEDTPSMFIETSEPVLVGLYFWGCGDPWSVGDPAMVLIPPVEQMVESATFCTYHTYYSNQYYTNVVCETSQVEGMMLDSIPIASEFDLVPGNTAYSYARLQLTNGVHRLSNSEGGFLSHVYGLGTYEGYSFVPASMVLTSELRVNNEPELEHPEGFFADIDETLNLKLMTNYNLIEAHWDFGDGSTAVETSTSTQHSYATDGDFPLSCDLYRQDIQGQIVYAGRVNTIIHVMPDEVEELQSDNPQLALAYPNPGGNTLNIRTALQNARLEVYDTNGRLIHSQALTENVTAIDAGGWAEEVYVWKVISNGKEAESGKWVKN